MPKNVQATSLDSTQCHRKIYNVVNLFVTITVESFKMYCQMYHNLSYESACFTLKLCKINKFNYQNLKHLSVCTAIEG